MLNVLYGLLTVFGIGLVIFVHELGHFLAARAVGIRVEVFSIGFGRRIWGFRRGPTDYRVSIFPLGGYVKMAGEDPTRPTTGQPDEFGSKTVSQRILVISAGVIMNLVFALVAIPIVFSVGVPFEVPVLGEVGVGGPAWEAGLRRGDRILTIDGMRVLGFEDIGNDVAVSSGSLDVVYERSGVRAETVVTPLYDEERGFKLIDIDASIKNIRVSEEWLASEPADANDRTLRQNLKDAGLGPEDVWIALNGIPHSAVAWSREIERLKLEPGAAARILVERQGRRRTVELPALPVAEDGEESWQIGVYGLRNKVKTVPARTAAAALGLRAGDRILRINGSPFVSHAALELQVGAGRHPRALLADGSGPDESPFADPMVRLDVERDGKELVLEASLPLPKDRVDLVESLLLEFDGPRIGVRPGSPAERAGFRFLDAVTAVDGKPISSWEALIKAVRGSKGRPLDIQVRRGTGSHSATVAPERLTSNVPVPPRVAEYEREFLRIPVAESFAAGVAYTGRMLRRVVQTLRSLISGSVAKRHLAGPIAIFTISMGYSKIGLMRGLLFLAMVSINLAILNILPIPVLDGGWLVFLIIERIKGSPVSEKTMGYFQWAGLAAVLSLMVFVTWNDVVRLVTHW